MFWPSGLGLRWGTLHPNLGVSVNDRSDTSKLYVGVLWDLEAPFGMFLNLGVGTAIHDGRRDTSDDDGLAGGSARLRDPAPAPAPYNHWTHVSVTVACGSFWPTWA